MPKNSHIRTDWPAARYHVEPKLGRNGARASLGPVVYAIRTMDGLIKIGSTVNLGRRLRSLKSEFGEHKLLCFQPGTPADEKALHAKWRPHRAHGREWYHPAPEILDWINENRMVLGRGFVAA